MQLLATRSVLTFPIGLGAALDKAHAVLGEIPQGGGHKSADVHDCESAHSSAGHAAHPQDVSQGDIGGSHSVLKFAALSSYLE